MNSKRVVIIYGPPGGGKGTQAELLVRRYGFFNFDTGRYLENTVHAEENQKNPVIRRERELFDSGKLCTPSFVLKIIKKETKKLATLGADLVFSGSPRTIYEAFGDKSNKGLLDLLKSTYGKENIDIVFLKIPPEVSLKRNSHRKVCSVCGLQVLAKVKHARCPLCDGKTKTRTLDKPEVIKVRLDEFKNRTYPIVVRVKKEKYKVYEIDGTPAPFEVHEKIIKALKLKK
ncbi:nucleoside monophosphate kinase [Patescibacteria group bacterium]|nr:nucleoside monophosphate kinase [Patescibacteria group bacterium]